jgi:hypothetical protein
MKTIVRVLTVGGGWAPLAVFALDVVAVALGLYGPWPAIDIPMHFLGGIAIAFFFSRSFHALPGDSVRADRRALLELLLVGSLTATAAVSWEFLEYTLDHVLGTRFQIDNDDTMKDMAIGIAGGVVFILARARQLRVGRRAFARRHDGMDEGAGRVAGQGR